jgi:hypothetical protein
MPIQHIQHCIFSPNPFEAWGPGSLGAVDLMQHRIWRSCKWIRRALPASWPQCLPFFSRRPTTEIRIFVLHAHRHLVIENEWQHVGPGRIGRDSRSNRRRHGGGHIEQFRKGSFDPGQWPRGGRHLQVRLEGLLSLFVLQMPSADLTQRSVHLNFHHHACKDETCWRSVLEKGLVNIPANERADLLNALGIATQTIDPPAGCCKLISDKSPPLRDFSSCLLEHREINQRMVQKVSFQMQLRPHRSGEKTQSMPVMATFDPGIKGSWISSRIVKRLNFEHQQGSSQKNVPPVGGDTFPRTRIYVDLTCGGRREGRQCRHRFFVVNHYPFDLLLGSEDGS